MNQRYKMRWRGVGAILLVQVTIAALFVFAMWAISSS
jgi:hypothetical protein